MSNLEHQNRLKTLIQKQFVIITIIFSTMIANTLSDCKQNVTINQKYTNDIPDSNSENSNVPPLSLSDLMQDLRQLQN